MRGVAYGASLSNLVSIDQGERHQLHEHVQSLQGFSGVIQSRALLIRAAETPLLQTD